jgi:hypothetical protein
VTAVADDCFAPLDAAELTIELATKQPHHAVGAA